MGADAMCDIAQNPAAYDGRTVVIRGNMFAGMHGAALFNDDCYESPMTIRFESGSRAEKRFDELYVASLYAARELRRVEATGTVHLAGDSYYLDVTSVRRAPKDGATHDRGATGQ